MRNETIVREYFKREGYSIIETKDYKKGMIGCFGVKNNHYNTVVTEINIDGTTEDKTSIDSQIFIIDTHGKRNEEVLNNDLRILASLFNIKGVFNI